jgi:hypothetical protein
MRSRGKLKTTSVSERHSDRTLTMLRNTKVGSINEPPLHLILRITALIQHGESVLKSRMSAVTSSKKTRHIFDE